VKLHCKSKKILAGIPSIGFVSPGGPKDIGGLYLEITLVETIPLITTGSAKRFLLVNWVKANVTTINAKRTIPKLISFKARFKKLLLG
jgi:hypothetical protein